MQKRSFIRGLGAMAVCLLAVSVGRGQHTQPAANSPATKAKRFLLLTEQGPLILDLAILIDGKPLGSERERIVRELIAAADTNKDNKTTWQEAIESGKFKIGQLKFLAKTNPDSYRRRLKMFDEIENGQVDFAEASRLWTLYTDSDDLISFTTRYFIPRQAYAYPYLLSCLDTDNDHILSAKEIQASRRMMTERDTDDNEVLELTELSRKRIQKTGKRLPTSIISRVSIVHLEDVDPEFLIGQLRANYLWNGSESMGAKVYARFVKRLDANSDGKLAPDEVAKVTALPGHFDLTIFLGQPEQARRYHLNSVAPELKEKIQVISAGSTVSFRFDNLQLQLMVGQRFTTANLSEQTRSVFQSLDRDKNGYLELSEVEKDTDIARAADFTSWDADNDGQVVLQELTAYYQKQNELRRRGVSILNVPRGRTIWNWLDVNGDRRLSLREMRVAEQRLRKCDRNKDGKITTEEIPTTITVQIVPGSAELPFTRRPFGTALPIGNAPVGPAWFVRMDRNGDGDVSPQEFLGDEKQFKRLDKDKDGLIDLEEAAAAR